MGVFERIRFCVYSPQLMGRVWWQGKGGAGAKGGGGEDGVIEALCTSLHEMEAELGPSDPNVLSTLNPKPVTKNRNPEPPNPKPQIPNPKPRTLEQMS